ncbi:MAG: thioredoxin family protein [Saprospiraceae bacterium]
MPHTKQPDHPPRLKLLGVGSADTRALKANIKEALRQLSLNIIVDDIERLEQLMEYDISGIPALAYNGKVLFQKMVPSVEDLKELFQNLLLNHSNGNGNTNGKEAENV